MDGRGGRRARETQHPSIAHESLRPGAPGELLVNLPLSLTSNRKPTLVISGVNITNTGVLAVFTDALTSLSSECRDAYRIIALVHSKSLFDIPGIEFMEYPDIKRSWSKRLYFEYVECRTISEQIRPHLWLAMHDVTPNVTASIRAVYCHNPNPYYPFRVSDALLDWKFGVFTLLYRFLYAINLNSNDFVIVQQDWLRRAFQKRYGLRNVIVAHPSVGHVGVPAQTGLSNGSEGLYRFFYPSFPRVFKNFEQILRAAQELEASGFDRFELWLTIDGTETRYARKLFHEFSSLTTIRWLGLLPREEVMLRYQRADCLIFPSKLETWGMPLTEFKSTGKPILAIDLPYAHETVGEYGQAAFFPPGGDIQLAAMMRAAVNHGRVFGPVRADQIAQPFAENWQELWKMLLG